MSTTTLEKTSSSVSAETTSEDGSDTLFDKKLHEVFLDKDREQGDDGSDTLFDNKLHEVYHAYDKEQAALAENGSTVVDMVEKR